MIKIILVSISLCLCGCSLAATPEGFVKIAVVDEDGVRLEGCQITVLFENEGKSITRTGVSSTASLFEAQAPASIPRCTVIVEKNGYYKSRKTKMFEGRDTASNRYEPWGEVRIITLRKVIEPQVGKSSVINGLIPEFDTPLGFDVLIGDWVAPFGKGKVSDFVFVYTFDETAKIASYIFTCPNKGDGVIEMARDSQMQSVFKWPHKALLDGYQDKLKKKQTYFSGDADQLLDYEELPRQASDIKYVFRVRTKYDEKGNIESAYYGKIDSAMMLWNHKLRFGYWVNDNPTSRSLESTHPTSP